MAQVARTGKQLAAELRRFRRAQRLTQVQLSRLTRKRQATLSNLEAEGSGTLDTLFAVLAALNLELVLRPRVQGERPSLGDIF